eukprot:246024-Chlamydomonas_euryale.AAC.1
MAAPSALSRVARAPVLARIVRAHPQPGRSSNRHQTKSCTATVRIKTSPRPCAARPARRPLLPPSPSLAASAPEGGGVVVV